MAQNGRKMRISASDGVGAFAVIAGAQEESFTLENGEIDITNKDSAARRTLLVDGTQSINMSVSGVFVSGVSAADIFSKAQAGTIDEYQVEWEDGEKLVADFQIRSYERTGAHDGAVTFTGELASSGDYVHTAAT